MCRVLVLAALLIGLTLRLYQLGGESLWYDETVSVYLARLSLPAMLAHTAGDIHPPAYYAMLHFWQALTSPTLAHGLEFLYAYPSLFFGLLALPLLFAIGRRLFGERTALVALWLAAFNPFQLWYSQEVRMYTLGVALGLLCLWAMLKFVAPKTHHRRVQVGWLAVYSLSAAAGLYTLYYFLFLLIALNLLALLYISLHEKIVVKSITHERAQTLAAWLFAQAVVLFLWLPWLPTFWRQATDPPVPPWRSSWNSPAAFLQSLAETLAAPLVGQTPPAALNWPWALVTVFLLTAFIALAVTQTGRKRLWLHIATPLVYVFVPFALLFIATLLGAPIYHVRYLVLYALPFLLIPAWLTVHAWQRQRWLGTGIWIGLLTIAALSLLAFWTNPVYRADDHRQAVADLARRWRPGDAILANAGWIYPVLTTYWPSELDTPDAAVPPPLQSPIRLNDYTKITGGLSLATPPLIRSGSVDGPSSLGWGAPSSDFFAISAGATTAALDLLADHARRIWHYRLYDTVSDPQGLIRTWLAGNTTSLDAAPIPGRDFGLLELFATHSVNEALTTATTPVTSVPLAIFDEAIALVEAQTPLTISAGSYLYTDLLWQALPSLATLSADLSTSLRLYDASGQQVAQADAPPQPAPTRTWTTNNLYRQAAALPVPANLPPGAYTLQIIVYRQDTTEALFIDVAGDQSWVIAEIDLQPANLH